MRALVVVGLLGALTLGAGGRAAAQQLEAPRHRQGYYAAIGLSLATSVARENGETLGPWFGNGLALRFGELVTRRFTLGLAIETGSTKKSGQTGAIAALGLESSWELVNNFSVRGGVGFGTLQLKNPNDPFESTTRGAAGAWFSTGLAYDWFLPNARRSGGWAITPTVQVRYLPGDTWGVVSFVGAELTYWTGLPREQLQLPPSEAWNK